MKISIIVTLKKEVLDPQGKVINQTINDMNIKNVTSVRQGKYFEIEISSKNLEEAKKKVDEICKKLLVNSVIEDYKVLTS